MKILVCPHDLSMGGSQINAIELAAAVRDRGHAVTVTAPEGVLVSTIRELGLDYVPVPQATRAPFPRALHLSRLAATLRPDVIHAYEWRPAIEATFGPHLLRRVPLLVTVLSMEVPGFLPRHVPLIVGTRDLAAQWSTAGRPARLLEPPIDTARNRSSEPAAARLRWGLRPDEIVVSVVCRLTHELEKLEGVLEAIDAVERLASRRPIRLLVAGGGEGLAEVRRRARLTNARLGRELVVVTGELIDPRDAYDAADIVLGMGSSALKGMSFSRPLVVQGTGGFWKLLDEGSAPLFMQQGWFGHGRQPIDLALILDHLAGDRDLRTQLGAMGRRLVEAHFSLDHAAERLIGIYDEVASARTPAGPRLASLGRSAARVAKFGAVTGWRAFAGRVAR